jgi:pimeloyl-ACP methyl ester carboxylesterase
MWKLLLLLPIGYLAICIALFLAQGKLLFPAGMVSGAGPLPPSAKRLVVENEGEQLHGVHIPPRAADGERLTILGFGGNAWNAEAAALYLHDLYPQADVVAFHYRGYKPSTGTPSAAALLADAPVIHDHVAAMLKPDRVVAVGFSVGSGVAARLASVRSLEGIILVTPFESLRSVASSHYPWLPVPLLFRHEMPAARDLAGSQVPTALIAAEADTLITPARTAALRKVVPNLVYDRTIRGAGHNDIYDRPDFRTAMRNALAALAAMTSMPES